MLWWALAEVGGGGCGAAALAEACRPGPPKEFPLTSRLQDTWGNIRRAQRTLYSGIESARAQVSGIRGRTHGRFCTRFLRVEQGSPRGTSVQTHQPSAPRAASAARGAADAATSHAGSPAAPQHAPRPACPSGPRAPQALQWTSCRHPLASLSGVTPRYSFILEFHTRGTWRGQQGLARGSWRFGGPGLGFEGGGPLCVWGLVGGWWRLRGWDGGCQSPPATTRRRPARCVAVRPAGRFARSAADAHQNTRKPGGGPFQCPKDPTSHPTTPRTAPLSPPSRRPPPAPP